MRRFVKGAVLALAATALATPAATGAMAPPSSVRLNELSCETDWVEVVNTHATLSAAIGGWWLADDPAATAKAEAAYVFPAGTVLKPRAVFAVPAGTVPFGIGCDADDVHLIAQPGAVPVDRVVVPNLASGYTWARFGGTWSAGVPTLGAANAAVPAGAVVDAAAWMFDPSVETRVDLTIAQPEIDKLLVDPETYVAATFRMTNALNQRLPAKEPVVVGVRLKGNVGSRTSPVYGPGGLDIVDDKVGLKIKMNFSVKGQTLSGLKKLTFNNMVQDPTMTHEVLSYNLFRAYGIYAPRTGFVNVYINGVLRGLFLNIETYDEIALAWQFPDLAHAYEGEAALADDSGLTWVPSEITLANVVKGFEIDVGDEGDRSDLAALASALEDATGLPPAAKRLLDVDEIAAYFAVEKYVNHWDGYSGSTDYSPKNFYLLSDRSGRFQLAPWGTDQAWVPLKDFLSEVPPPEAFDTARGVLFNACLADDYCASVYRRTLADLAIRAAGVADAAWLLMLQHAASRVADTVRIADEALTFVTYDRTKTVMERRPADVQAYLSATATGRIRWTPSTRTLKKGTRITSAHLNAYSDVPGTFTYSVKLGRVLPVGRYWIKAHFTPTDPNRMASTKSLQFTVR